MSYHVSNYILIWISHDISTTVGIQHGLSNLTKQSQGWLPPPPMPSICHPAAAKANQQQRQQGQGPSSSKGKAHRPNRPSSGLLCSWPEQNAGTLANLWLPEGTPDQHHVLTAWRVTCLHTTKIENQREINFQPNNIHQWPNWICIYYSKLLKFSWLLNLHQKHWIFGKC